MRLFPLQQSARDEFFVLLPVAQLIVTLESPLSRSTATATLTTDNHAVCSERHSSPGHLKPHEHLQGKQRTYRPLHDNLVFQERVFRPNAAV